MTMAAAAYLSMRSLQEPAREAFDANVRSVRHRAERARSTGAPEAAHGLGNGMVAMLALKAEGDPAFDAALSRIIGVEAISQSLIQLSAHGDRAGRGAAAFRWAIEDVITIAATKALFLKPRPNVAITGAAVMAGREIDDETDLATILSQTVIRGQTAFAEPYDGRVIATATDPSWIDIAGIVDVAFRDATPSGQKLLGISKAAGVATLHVL